jgi:predicted phosphodiesterase
VIAGFLSDAHGNPDGLERCLRALELQRPERIYFLGDAVGYFPEENAVLDLLRSRQVTCLRGNHEALLLGELPLSPERDRVYRITDARRRLRPAHRKWIEQWPDRLEVEIGRRRLLLLHGSPADPLQGYVYPDGDLSLFDGLPFDAVLVGHTHRAFLAKVGPVTIVNAGSCGMPRDAGTLASCATYDDTTGGEILRVPFDATRLHAKWIDRVHPSALACFDRSSPGGVSGRMVRV